MEEEEIVEVIAEVEAVKEEEDPRVDLQAYQMPILRRQRVSSEIYLT